MLFEEVVQILRNSLVPAERRQAAEELLSDFELSESVVEELAKTLIDPDSGVRDVVATALTNLTGTWKDVAVGFITPYFAHPNIEIRNTSGDIILKLRPANLNPIIQFFYDLNPDNVKFAIDIFGQIANSEYMDLLLEMIHHHDDNVRAAIIEAIGNIYENYPENEFNRSTIIDSFFTLYESDEVSRPHILDALGKVCGSEAQDFLLHQIQNEEDFFLRIAAVDSLSICGNDISTCFSLMELIDSVNDELKIIFLKTIYAIAFRLGQQIELPQKYRYVAHLALMDNNPDIYGAGLVALGSSFKKEDASYLLNVVFRNDSDIQQYILSTLVVNSEKQVIEEFFKLFFIKFDLTDQENLDFLSYLTIVARNASEENQKTVIKTIIKNLIIHKPIYWESVFTYCLEISNEEVILKLKKYYEISDTSEIEFIDELCSKFNITL